MQQTESENEDQDMSMDKNGQEDQNGDEDDNDNEVFVIQMIVGHVSNMYSVQCVTNTGEEIRCIRKVLVDGGAVGRISGPKHVGAPR
jgi:hypothetical protein